MHQMLTAIAAIRVSHSSGEKYTLSEVAELQIATVRNASQHVHLSDRCHQVSRRSAVRSGRFLGS